VLAVFAEVGVRWYLLPADRVDYGSVQRPQTLIVAFPGYHGYPDNNRPVQPLGSTHGRTQRHVSETGTGSAGP
jgi:hypothetical protein